jgi:PAS domain S-box-containing protein
MSGTNITSPRSAEATGTVDGLEPEPAAGMPLTGAHHGEPINILLVDDEPRNLTVLETILEDPAYRLVRAESAEQALLALVVEEFALLVLDIQMPGMSGFELAQMVKQRKKTAGIPIIFLTAYYSEDQHVLEGYGTGAVDYLHKPINPAILRSKVAVFAELYRKNRESERVNRALSSEVTARRAAEEQLRRLNEELERRVAERTGELLRVNDTLLDREREMRSLADNTPDILSRFDRQFHYVFANAAIEKATGRPRDEFLGRSMRDVDMPRELRELWEQALREVFATRRMRSFEFTHPGPDGVRHYVTRLVPEAGPSGDVETVLGVTEDVTERKCAEEALKEADRRKDEFLATLAHELRNPLAPIRTGLHLLSLTEDPSVATQSREMMHRQLSHMVRLIDDLMDVSRITSGKVTLRKERVLLRALAESALETSRPVIEASRHSLTVNLPAEPVWLTADPTRLAQVIGNLLTNAAKYTPEGGSIELVAVREGREVSIRVKDSGLGIPPGMLADVFEMFTQVNRTLDRSQGGLGIGLALVKRIVDLHGGTIAADSPGLGEGSTFTLRLPLDEADDVPAEQTSPAEPAWAPSSSSHRRVLVVDDNRDGAESLAMVIEMSGHEVRTAHSGPDALDVARDFQPEVVFLDIGLPGMDGYEVARHLRQQPTHAGALIVALTGWGSEDHKRQSKEAGFDLHLTKPVEAAAIEGILERLMRDPR